MKAPFLEMERTKGGISTCRVHVQLLRSEDSQSVAVPISFLMPLEATPTTLEAKPGDVQSSVLFNRFTEIRFSSYKIDSVDIHDPTVFSI